MHQLDNGRKILEEIETRNAQFYICAHNVLVCPNGTWCLHYNYHATLLRILHYLSFKQFSHVHYVFR